MVKHCDKYFFEDNKQDIKNSDNPNDTEADYLFKIAGAVETFILTSDLVGRVSEKKFLFEVPQEQGALAMMSGALSVANQVPIAGDECSGLFRRRLLFEQPCSTEKELFEALVLTHSTQYAV